MFRIANLERNIDKPHNKTKKKTKKTEKKTEKWPKLKAHDCKISRSEIT